MTPKQIETKPASPFFDRALNPRVENSDTRGKRVVGAGLGGGIKGGYVDIARQGLSRGERGAVDKRNGNT